jgi:hypothetical protein
MKSHIMPSYHHTIQPTSTEILLLYYIIILLGFNVNAGESECAVHTKHAKLKYNIQISDDFFYENGM